MSVSVIRGEDKEFTIRLVSELSQEPFDLTGLTADGLSMKLPGEDADLELTLDVNANASKLELVSALAGKFKCILSDVDSALLSDGDGQSMEVTIKAGAGPDYDITKVQLIGELDVKRMLFE